MPYMTPDEALAAMKAEITQMEECIEVRDSELRRELLRAQLEVAGLRSNFAILSSLLAQQGLLSAKSFSEAQDQARIDLLNKQLGEIPPDPKP